MKKIKWINLLKNFGWLHRLSHLVISSFEFNESSLFPQIRFSGHICYIMYCDYTWLLKLLTERFSHPLEWPPYREICELVTVCKCWSCSNSLERSDNHVWSSHFTFWWRRKYPVWAHEQTQACFCPKLLNLNKSCVPSCVPPLPHCPLTM